ncbi:MAG TPA: hypothetical protein VLK30_04260 [Candidatus Limnocylindrales bacterium]|nr:hypothetical protein [Candidatus Limnocylindrales bacterium]
MTRGRLAAVGLVLGVVASQAGHLLAFQLRYGSAAQQLQSAGAHAYFPSVVKTGLGLGAGFFLLALLVVGAARLLAGRRLETTAPPSLLRSVALLFWIQLACFVVQESAESAAGAAPTSPAVLLLWGTAGQLPVALVAAVALRWLAVRVGPALASLRARLVATLQLAPSSSRLVVLPVAIRSTAPHDPRRGAFSRRGPPL